MRDELSDAERAEPERATTRLFLAGQDMAECRAAAQFLDSQHLPGDVCRALETAIPVAYARPWGHSNTIGALGEHWLPPRDDFKRLHAALILIRNKVYAHTDEEIEARGITDPASKLQRLAEELLASGADPSTIRNALKPLQVIYRRAIEDGDLAVNPCERLRLPAARGRRERIASPTEAAALIAALRLEDRALWGCAFYAGLRRGELRALLWNDVELAGGLIHVERSMDSYGDAGEPKSRAGRRGVPIVAALRDLLVEHKLVTRRDAGLAFGSSPTQPFTPTAVRKRALTAWRRAGLDPIGLHECRHTFASLLIAAGVNAKAITAYLGHASIQTTFDLYGHLMPGNEDEAVALVDAYLERADTAHRLTQTR